MLPTFAFHAVRAIIPTSAINSAHCLCFAAMAYPQKVGEIAYAVSCAPSFIKGLILGLTLRKVMKAPLDWLKQCKQVSLPPIAGPGLRRDDDEASLAFS